jgi:hypothetical protein
MIYRRALKFFQDRQLKPLGHPPKVVYGSMCLRVFASEREKLGLAVLRSMAKKATRSWSITIQANSGKNSLEREIFPNRLTLDEFVQHVHETIEIPARARKWDCNQKKDPEQNTHPC